VGAQTPAQQEDGHRLPEYYFGQIFEAKQQPGTVCLQRAPAARLAAGDDRRDGPERLQEDHHA